ncbi:MAG: hypothetical protein GY863_14620 [bacterium]|nr:hypothetical protein [bacterium]
MEALGVCLDGNELKLAHLKKEKDIIEIISLEKIILKEIVADRKTEEAEEESYEDVFGLEKAEEQEMAVEDTGMSDDELLYNTFSKYSKQNLKIGTNILQSDISFTNIPAATVLKTKELKKKIKGELSAVSSEITDENFDFVLRKNNEFIAFYHNNKLELLNRINDLKSSISELTISQVSINEIALMNLFRGMIEDSEEVNILVYVGNEYSRILFFQGKELVNFSVVINDGYHSDNVTNDLYAKIVLEMDTGEIEDINNVYIAGDGSITKYKEFFQGKFSDSNVTTFSFEEKFHVIDEGLIPDLDCYALPISIAWNILEGKKNDFIESNFLPKSIRKQQQAFTVAWHGYLLLSLVIFSLGFFLWKNYSINKKIDDMITEIEYLDLNITEISPIALTTDSLYNEINILIPRLALVDSLKPRFMTYSSILEYLSLNTRDLNSIWIRSFNSSGRDFFLNGSSLFRTRVHGLANTFEESVITEMTPDKIMGRNIYHFSISGKIPYRK